MTVDYRIGDTRDVVAAIPDGSVSLVASSPPFIALRSYLPADHPDKAAEIGSEPDPATFIDTLLELTAEWGRVLAPWGSIAIELGDTYAGGDRTFVAAVDRPQDGGYSTATRVHDGRGSGIRNLHGKVQGGGPGWPRAKSLALIPQLYATSLAYGRNLLTGQPSPAVQWLVRNVIVWHRPNPAVGALGDKVRPSTSYITVATRSPKRWFDLDAVRGDAVVPQMVRVGTASASRGISGGDSGNPDKARPSANPAGAPPLDCWFDVYDVSAGAFDEHDTWTITTQPSSLAHYAMWPAKLAERLILMMCPAEVCAVCGTPRRRLTSEPTYTAASGRVVEGKVWPSAIATRGAHSAKTDGNVTRSTRSTRTLGWSDCGCGDYCAGHRARSVRRHGHDWSRRRPTRPRRHPHRPRRPQPRPVPAPSEECARALFGMRGLQMAGQLGLFG